MPNAKKKGPLATIQLNLTKLLPTSFPFNLLNPEVLSSLGPIDFHPDTQYPMITLRSAPCFEHNRSTRYTQAGYKFQSLARATTLVVCRFVCAEKRFAGALPDDETGHCVFVLGCPSVFEVDFR